MRGTWESNSRQAEAGAAIAERLGIEIGERVMHTKYLFREAGEPMMLSTSWEPLAVTGRTPVMLPEEGPLGGMGVVERMRAIDVIVDNVTEEVGARPGLAEELHLLGGVPGHVVWSSSARTTPPGAPWRPRTWSFRRTGTGWRITCRCGEGRTPPVGRGVT